MNVFEERELRVWAIEQAIGVPGTFRDASEIVASAAVFFAFVLDGVGRDALAGSLPVSVNSKHDLPHEVERVGSGSGVEMLPLGLGDVDKNLRDKPVASESFRHNETSVSCVAAEAEREAGGAVKAPPVEPQATP